MNRPDPEPPPPPSYEFSGGILRVELAGSQPAEQIVGAFEAALDDPRTPLRPPVLVDASRSTGDRPTSEVRSIIDTMSRHRHRFGPIAVVVDSPLHYGLARMAASLAEFAGMNVAVFRDEEAAVRHLESPGET